MDMENSAQNETQTYPGIRRLPYFLILLGLYAAVVAIMVTMSTSQPLIVNVALLVFMVGLFFICAQRYRNQGASGWWAAGMIVPILNLYVSIRAFAYPEGYTAHKKFDGPAKIIIAVYLLVFIVGVGAAIALPAYQEYMEKTASSQQVNP